MGSRAARDLGLRRIGTTTRWLGAGAVVAGAALSTAVAKQLPGVSPHSSQASSPASSPGTSLQPAAGGDDYSGYEGGESSPAASGYGYSSPTSPPRVAAAPPVVSSGGS